jgi:hypothetical protein
LKSIKQNNNLGKNNDDNILRPNFKKLVFINEIYKNIFKINERINCPFFVKEKKRLVIMTNNEVDVQQLTLFVIKIITSFSRGRLYS